MHNGIVKWLCKSRLQVFHLLHRGLGQRRLWVRVLCVVDMEDYRDKHIWRQIWIKEKTSFKASLYISRAVEGNPATVQLTISLIV